MSQGYEFYMERAEQSAAEARSALLDNVRERALRSEATWRGLAEQARGVARERSKIEHAKAAARAEEAAANEDSDEDADLEPFTSAN